MTAQEKVRAMIEARRRSESVERRYDAVRSIAREADRPGRLTSAVSIREAADSMDRQLGEAFAVLEDATRAVESDPEAMALAFEQNAFRSESN